MMRRRMMMGALCVALCVSVSLGADKRVTDLLDKMPAEGSVEGTKLTAELVALGPDAIKEVCQLLVPPGTGDDSKARFALSGLAMYCSRPDAEPERKMYAGVLIEALGAASDNEVRAFLIRQLQLAGKDDAVAPLSQYLSDDRLCDPAAQGLLAINTPAATAELAKALPTAKGKNLVTLLRAMAERRVKEAVEGIKPHATSQDTDTRRMALYALANIGDPSCAEILAKAAQATEPFERARATSYYLLFARRIAEAGNADECARICREMIKTRTEPRDKNVQCAALSTLVSTIGKKALDDLLAALASPNKDIREAALALVCAIKDEMVTIRCVNKMAQAGPELKVEMLGMLGRRGDKMAMPAVLEALKDKDKSVKLAAIPAAACLGGDEAIPALMAVLQTDQADEVAAVKDVLVRMPGEKVLTAAANGVPKAPSASRVALLEVLASRRAKKHVNTVFAACKDEDGKARLAAIKALGDVASPEHLPQLIGAVLLKTEDPGDQAAAQKSIAAVAKQIPDSEKRADEVLAAMAKESGERRASLVQTLARIGGQKALETALADLKSQDEKVQDSAVRALADWQDAAAAPELMKIASTSEKLPHQVLALRGYVRIAREANLSEKTKIKMFQEAMAAAKRPEEKTLVLGGLADVRSVESAKVAAPCLDDPALQTAAALAIAKIVCPKDKRDKGIDDGAVGPALKKAIPFITDEKLRKAAEEHLSAIPIPDEMNLALRKPVKADKPPEGDRKPEFAVDGNAADLNGSAWFARGWPVTLTIDLEKPAKVESVQTYFYWDGARYYQYTVDLSLDGNEWKTVVDQSQNTTPGTAKGVLHNFAPTEARYVRLNILKNSVNPSVHLVEIKVYGEGSTPKPPPPPKADAEGFLPLFNGKDMTGWIGSVNGYYVQDGVLICDPKKGGFLMTEKQYSDFIFRFEFKLPPGGNNGVSIRYPGKGSGSYDGMEIQILDDTAEKHAKLHPYQYHGSVYGIVPAEKGHQKPVGEWNSEEITAQGPHITVKLNGAVIVDADLSKIEKPMDDKEHPGMRSPSGYVGFLGHGDQVEFRNIRIKELK